MLLEINLFLCVFGWVGLWLRRHSQQLLIIPKFPGCLWRLDKSVVLSHCLYMFKILDPVQVQ